jgi:hypothetical protein
MKAEIKMDPSTKSGILKITSETPVEAYALCHWWQNFDKGNNESMFSVDYDIPVPPSQAGEVEG